MPCLAAALALLRGRKTLLIDLAPSQQQYLVPGPRHDRSQHGRGDRRSGVRARSSQPVGDAQFRLKDRIDKQGVSTLVSIRRRSGCDGQCPVVATHPDSDSVVLLRARRNAICSWRLRRSGSLRIPASASGRRDHARQAAALALDIREQIPERANAVAHPGGRGGHRKCQNGRLHDGPADNERLQKWLESLDSEELGKYKM